MIFTGYQAFGTLGRRIVDGAKTVRLFGEEIAGARVEIIGGLVCARRANPGCIGCRHSKRRQSPCGSRMANRASTLFQSRDRGNPIGSGPSRRRGHDDC